jgi:ankyrin repeat protein
VSNNHADVAEFLVEHGATELSHPGVGAELCALAAHGDLAGLKAKVAEGKSLLSADYDGRTALHLAACKGHAEIVDFLVNPGGGKPGIHIDTRDRWGGTALEDAERSGEQAAADKLRALGATTTTHLKTVIGGEALSDVPAVASVLVHGEALADITAVASVLVEPAQGTKSTSL